METIKVHVYARLAKNDRDIDVTISNPMNQIHVRTIILNVIDRTMKPGEWLSLDYKFDDRYNYIESP